LTRYIKVLIVEDDADFAFLLHKLLKQYEDIEVIGCRSQKKDVMQKVQEEHPDIVLMDLNLGTSYMDGVCLSKEIRVLSDAKVLILTALNTSEGIYRVAREAFASGYLFKDQLSLLVENIRAMAKGYTAQEYMIAFMALSCLSEAERTVFQIMMGKEITIRSSAKTIANQKSQIVKKLGFDNQKELIHVFQIFQENRAIS
jgi:DNA-binding NarL/FixJ family response regulator